MGPGNVEVRAKVSENSNDTILSRATAAVSESLLQQVTTSFKRLFRFHYESSDEIAQSPEWQEIDKLFGNAVDTYVSIAMNNRRKIRGDLFLWVKAQIEVNESAILIQHFSCDRKGYLRTEKTSKHRLTEHRDAWSAQEHMGLMNQNSVFMGLSEKYRPCIFSGTWECSDPNRIRKDNSPSACNPGYFRDQGTVMGSLAAHSFHGAALGIRSDGRQVDGTSTKRVPNKTPSTDRNLENCCSAGR